MWKAPWLRERRGKNAEAFLSLMGQTRLHKDIIQQEISDIHMIYRDDTV